MYSSEYSPSQDKQFKLTTNHNTYGLCHNLMSCLLAIMAIIPKQRQAKQHTYTLPYKSSTKYQMYIKLIADMNLALGTWTMCHSTFYFLEHWCQTLLNTKMEDDTMQGPLTGINENICLPNYQSQIWQHGKTQKSIPERRTLKSIYGS